MPHCMTTSHKPPDKAIFPRQVWSVFPPVHVLKREEESEK